MSSAASAPRAAQFAVLPQVGYYTGDVDAHDLAVTPEGGRFLFVNTLFSCIATVSETHSFKLVWKPPFIDRLAAEDRCHLNGLALDKGKLRYATAVSESNVADGWRDHRADGGIVIDCQSNEIIRARPVDAALPAAAQGQAVRAQFRYRPFRHGRRQDRKIRDDCVLPRLPARPRHCRRFRPDRALQAAAEETFSGLALDDNLKKHKIDARCGIYVVDLKSGDMVHRARLEGLASELYDVAVLPDRRRPRYRLQERRNEARDLGPGLMSVRRGLRRVASLHHDASARASELPLVASGGSAR